MKLDGKREKRDNTRLFPDFSMSEAAFDDRSLRNALGRYATGVAVVTALTPDGKPIGLTINSFAAVSLNPALVLWSLDNGSSSLDAFSQASHHAINVLAADQKELSQLFASRNGERFVGLDWQPGLGGAPLFAGTCATFEVANETRHPGGDHTIFIGRVERLGDHAERDPLLFFGGRYRALVSG